MKLRLIIALALMLATTLSTMSQTRRALVVGLGEQLDPSWEKINGDRDVPLVVEMLEANGFTDISTLINSKATKKGIVKALSSLASRSRRGDILYIHFSGHGQRITDLDGDETDDRWDESWIPYDAFQSYGLNDRGEKHLTDDELGLLLTAARDKVGAEGTIVVAVDACHSGDATRGPVDGRPAIRGVMQNFVIPGAVMPQSPAPAVEEKWLTLSACKDYQLNLEHPAGFGSLTYALYELWPELAGADNRTVVKAVRKHMRKSGIGIGIPQEPMITSSQGEMFTTIFRHALQ